VLPINEKLITFELAALQGFSTTLKVNPKSNFRTIFVRENHRNLIRQISNGCLRIYVLESIPYQQVELTGKCNETCHCASTLLW